MTYLITGVAGFIGTNMALSCLKKGKKVVGIDNLITGNNKNIEHLLSYSNFDFFEVAIEEKRISKILKDASIDKIFHLACPTGVPNLEILQEEMMMSLSCGMKNILQLAKEKKASLVFSSSSEVYGDPQVFPQTEEYFGNVNPIGPRSPYEEGKRFSEALLMVYVKKYKIHASIIRIFNTYGPFFSEKDERVIPKFCTLVKKGKNLLIHGKGEQKRTFLFIDDLIEAFHLVMEKGNFGDVFNVGSTKQYKIIDVANLILQIVGETKSKIVFQSRPKHDHEQRLPSVEKIEKLGWKEKISLEEGITILLKN